MEEIGTVEVVGEELCFGDDEVGRGKGVLYHLLDDVRVEELRCWQFVVSVIVTGDLGFRMRNWRFLIDHG